MLPRLKRICAPFASWMHTAILSDFFSFYWEDFFLAFSMSTVVKTFFFQELITQWIAWSNLDDIHDSLKSGIGISGQTDYWRVQSHLTSRYRRTLLYWQKRSSELAKCQLNSYCDDYTISLCTILIMLVQLALVFLIDFWRF